MNWEEIFTEWSQGPGLTEQEKCNNAVNMVTDAIKNDVELSRFDISIFPQGSYKARTNIKLDSDVDVCVMFKDTFFARYPDGISQSDVGNISSPYLFSTFKDSIERCLINKFGRDQVKRGNKAFDVHANSYRVDADVVPTFEHRRYTGTKDYLNNHIYHSGVELITDKGQSIINWPEQNYQNGVQKNNETSRKYKRCIRILKNLRNQMQDDKIMAANDIASFLIECLIWNTPSNFFDHIYFIDTIRDVLAHLFNNTRNLEDYNEWVEVNELKYLFRNFQPWTLDRAHGFISSAWDYLGYE